MRIEGTLFSVAALKQGCKQICSKAIAPGFLRYSVLGKVLIFLINHIKSIGDTPLPFPAPEQTSESHGD